MWCKLVLFLDRGPPGCDPTCGQQEVAGDLPETEPESKVLETGAVWHQRGITASCLLRLEVARQDRCNVNANVNVSPIRPCSPILTCLDAQRRNQP